MTRFSRDLRSDDETTARRARIMADCWHRGNSIGETIGIVRRTEGISLTFEEVRRCFADISAGFVALTERRDTA